MAQGTCSVEGCGKPVSVKMRGWCSMHYARWLRHGDPHMTYPNSPKVCRIDGCNGTKGLVRRLCQMHYARWNRHGSTDVVLNVVRRLGDILETAAHSDTDECIILDPKSNPRPIVTRNGRTTTASRAVWTIANGDPGELLVLHLCNGGDGSNGCINIRHLYLGDYTQNWRDRKRSTTSGQLLQPEPVRHQDSTQSFPT